MNNIGWSGSGVESEKSLYRQIKKIYRDSIKVILFTSLYFKIMREFRDSERVVGT